jgi:hypothetical protein
MPLRPIYRRAVARGDIAINRPAESSSQRCEADATGSWRRLTMPTWSRRSTFAIEPSGRPRHVALEACERAPAG